MLLSEAQDLNVGDFVVVVHDGPGSAFPLHTMIAQVVRGAAYLLRPNNTFEWSVQVVFLYDGVTGDVPFHGLRHALPEERQYWVSRALAL